MVLGVERESTRFSPPFPCSLCFHPNRAGSWMNNWCTDTLDISLQYKIMYFETASPLFSHLFHIYWGRGYDGAESHSILYSHSLSLLSLSLYLSLLWFIFMGVTVTFTLPQLPSANHNRHLYMRATSNCKEPSGIPVFNTNVTYKTPILLNWYWIFHETVNSQYPYFDFKLPFMHCNIFLLRPTP